MNEAGYLVNDRMEHANERWYVRLLTTAACATELASVSSKIAQSAAISRVLPTNGTGLCRSVHASASSSRCTR